MAISNNLKGFGADLSRFKAVAQFDLDCHVNVLSPANAEGLVK